MNPCPRCAIAAERIWLQNEHAIAFAPDDAATDGHIIIVPRKHVGVIYELEIAEQQDVWALVAEARSRLLTGLMPDAFDIGFDDGEPGGAVHCAVHVVPRRQGDGLGTAAGTYVVDDLAL